MHARGNVHVNVSLYTYVYTEQQEHTHPKFFVRVSMCQYFVSDSLIFETTFVLLL